MQYTFYAVVHDINAHPTVFQETFDVYVEVEARHVTARERTITLKKGGVDRVVPFRETARIGFEWSFEWNDQKYRW